MRYRTRFALFMCKIGLYISFSMIWFLVETITGLIPLVLINLGLYMKYDRWLFLPSLLFTMLLKLLVILFDNEHQLMIMKQFYKLKLIFNELEKMIIIYELAYYWSVR